MPTALSRRHLVLLALITALGLLLRLWALQGSVVEDPVRGDATAYFSYAVNLQTEGVYSRATPEILGGAPVRADAAVPPVFPLFVTAFLGEDWRAGTMAGVYASIGPVLLAQALLGALLAPLLFFTGRGLLGTPLALAVAGLAAVSPHLVNINIYLLTEPVFTLLFWIALCLLAQATTPNARPWWALAAGAALAAAALTRPTVQYLPLVLVAFLVWRDPARWRRWTGLLAVFVALLAAWGLRNLAVTGSFGDPTAMAATLQHGSYPGFMFNGIPESRGIPYRFDTGMNTSMPVGETIAIILQRMQAAPGEYLHWYLLGKPLALFHWEILPIGVSDARLLTGGDIYIYPTPASPYAGNPLFILTYLLSYLLHRPLLVLAAVGTVLAWLPAGRAWFGEGVTLARLLGLAFLYSIGIHMLGAPFPRYAIPFLPLAWLLAGALLAAFWRRRRSGVTAAA